jgi:hypothetical protein
LLAFYGSVIRTDAISMIEAVFALIQAMVEALIAALSALAEAIAGLFSAGGEAMGAGEIIVSLFASVIELLFWLVLVLVELAVALFRWRKPRRVAKPRIAWLRRKEATASPADTKEQ